MAEDQALDHQRADQADPALRVLRDRQQFLADQGDDAQQRVEHGSSPILLRVARMASAISSVAMKASTAAFGRITGQMSPARNRVCRMLTK